MEIPARSRFALVVVISILSRFDVFAETPAPSGGIPLTPRLHMDRATQQAYDRIRRLNGWLLGVDAIGSAANPFVTVPPSQVRSRWNELYGRSGVEPACIEWEMAERNAPVASRDWAGLKAFADAGGLPWIMLSMNNFTVAYGSGVPPRGGMNDTTNRAAGVLPGGAGHDAFTTYVRKLAREVRDVGRPVVLRPLHEGNGGWFWWGGNAADYKALWVLVFGLFKEEGATNVIWLWAVGDVCGAGGCTATAFYPGDEYVDILGVDLYFTGGSFSNSAISTLHALEAIGKDKPLMIAELGPYARADYWQQAAQSFASIERMRGFSLWLARGWRAWGGSPNDGSLIDSSSDPSVIAAYNAFLSNTSVVSLERWIAASRPRRQRPVRP